MLVKMRPMRNITGSRIREARLAKHLTQEALAARLQMLGQRHTRNTIAKIETGIRQITDIELKLLSDVLGVTVAWFFQDTSDADS